jgi:hypothetical protein
VNSNTPTRSLFLTALIVSTAASSVAISDLKRLTVPNCEDPRFVRTAKNGAAEGFLEQHGFVLAGEGSGHWVAALSAVKASPPHVALTLS